MSTDASPPCGPLVRVALPLPIDEAFTYAVPEPLRADVVLGARVVVPFGTRTLTGVVVEEASEAAGETKDVLDVLDDGAAATPELLALTRWVADYYVCAWGEALRAALPSGLDVATEHRILRTGVDAGAVRPDLLAHPVAGAVLRHLGAHPAVTLAGLRQRVPAATLAILRRLERAGLVEIDTGLSEPRVAVKTEKRLRLAPAFRGAHAARDAAQHVRGAKQKAVIDALAASLADGDPEPAQAAVLARAGTTASTLKTLVAQGIVEAFEAEVRRDALGAASAASPPIDLHAAQRTALGEIEEAVAAGAYKTFLLHGVTGSGKTEVYIAALKAALARGRTGIVLVPEIALTPQTVRRFRRHFGDAVAVLHSRMSLGERYDAWRSIREGAGPDGAPVRVVIGPRSAIFAPLENVGLIVVDEEHESSYKQFDPAPRYHARDVAVVRARLANAVCVLGSATPSLESYHNARAGKYALLRMDERVPVAGGLPAPLPPVEIIDLAREQKRHQLDGSVSKALGDAIGARLAKGEQTILLQNRRGYAPVLECEACGWAPFCRDCAVPMTYHKAKGHLRCHYCGRTARRPAACPKCDARAWSLLGTGTQRVEEELAVRFPAARVVRMDLDTTGAKNAHRTILDGFGRGEADVLLGTQMVAKGLDFPRVTLVGVVNADAGLLLPDFRAEERTFQLLTQVAGRAGRADLTGEVFLQTRRPESRALAYAQRHDYDGFAASELVERAEHGWPPFGRVVGVEFRGVDEDAAHALAGRWTEAFREMAGAAFEVLGPNPALVARVKRLYRFHTVVKVPPGAPPVQPFLRRALAFVPAPPRTRVAVDVDAVALF